MRAGDLDSKVVLVTGGSRGIGREIVLGAVSRGAKVAFCAREIGPAAHAVLDKIKADGRHRQVIAVRADISREDDVQALFDTVLDTYGRVDVLVNNAGILLSSILVSHSTDEWDELMATNLTGTFLTSKRAIQEFLARNEGGRIISIGSIAQEGLQSNAGYAASKGGLVGLTRAIAQEYGSNGILAYLVVVGLVDTRLTVNAPDSFRLTAIRSASQWRVAGADEIASVVLFLASERTSCASGQVVYACDGSRGVPPY